MPNVARFLVVEDDLGVARAVVRALRPRPAIIATSVEKAIVLLEANRTTALILDVRLPDGSGFEVLARARSCAPLIEALMMSGDASFVNRAFEGNVQFVQKPVEAELIVAFAKRAEAKKNSQNVRVNTALDHWTSTHGLTPSERELLRAVAIDGVARRDLAERLKKSNETIKTLVHRLLAKTGHETMLDAALALLRKA